MIIYQNQKKGYKLKGEPTKTNYVSTFSMITDGEEIIINEIKETRFSSGFAIQL